MSSIYTPYELSASDIVRIAIIFIKNSTSPQIPLQLSINENLRIAEILLNNSQKISPPSPTQSEHKVEEIPVELKRQKRFRVIPNGKKFCFVCNQNIYFLFRNSSRSQSQKTIQSNS